MKAFPQFRRDRQRGVALLIGLVLLIVLSIVALVAMQLVSSQNRVAANAWGEQMSLATGEGALGATETKLLDGTLPADFAADAGGAYTFDSIDVPNWADPTFAWSGSNVLPDDTYSNSAYPQSTAQVMVEQLPSVVAPGESNCSGYGCNASVSGGALQVFRVTARAVGPNGRLPVLVQDTSVQ